MNKETALIVGATILALATGATYIATRNASGVISLNAPAGQPIAADVSAVLAERGNQSRNDHNAVADLQAELAQLRKQLDTESEARQKLAQEVAGLQTQLATLGANSATAAAHTADSPQVVGNVAPVTKEDFVKSLSELGVPNDMARDMKSRLDKTELKRLYVRDQAVREGWFRSDRYRDEIAKVDGETDNLRRDVGEETYDKILYATGQDNRLVVQRVMDGSAAANAGLQSNDVIVSYDTKRIFDWSELRETMAQGDAGKLITLAVKRADKIVEVSIPRGPLGVELDTSRVKPDV